jgi:predicted nucleic acid-binding protein
VTGYLLDTNVLCEPVRPNPEPRVTAWLDSAGEEILYLSVLTLGEIRKGISMVGGTGKRARLESWFAEIALRFSGRILPVDGAVAEQWGRMAGQAELQGKTLPVIDALLAATAAHHNLTMVTRNTPDLAATGAVLFNPWNT